ncbi:MAG: family 16 glycosylhydrolase [Ardenticatenaceae bacterium]|nr:family 16 glycosylhydrolase [Ardenticatenaceae bacterium]
MNDFLTSNNWPHPLRPWGINGGQVVSSAALQLVLSPAAEGYANAQIDDYSGRPRRAYPWHPGVELRIRARFSKPLDQLQGTAGFGFWNAPFGDPNLRTPALPQAIWFFMGGPQNNFPLNPHGPGRGFYAATLDAARWRALAMAPLAPAVVLLNRLPRFLHTVWPQVQKRLGMSYLQLNEIDLTRWHTYQIRWDPDESTFLIDGQIVQQTRQSPQGPLGFVCWIDNQYLQVTPTGKVAAGTVKTAGEQRLEISQLSANFY